MPWKMLGAVEDVDGIGTEPQAPAEQHIRRPVDIIGKYPLPQIQTAVLGGVRVIAAAEQGAGCQYQRADGQNRRGHDQCPAVARTERRVNLKEHHQQ